MSAFDQQLSLLKKEMTVQGRRVLDLCTQAVDCFFDSNIDKAREVILADDAIDKADVEIERASVPLLAMGQTQEHAIRSVLTIVKVNNELERIADLARGIAKKLIKLGAADGPPLPPAMIDLAFASRTMLSDVLAAMSNEDASLCRQVRRADQRVDDLHKEVLQWARQEIPRDVATSGQTIEMLTIAQRFERIADMTTNIAEDVIFLVEGRIVRHARDA